MKKLQGVPFQICRSILVIIICITAPSFTSPAFAQTGSPLQKSARISGALSDPSGAAVGEARITVAPIPASGEPERRVSQSDGTFEIRVAPGRYRVLISHDLLEPYDHEVSVAAGETRELRLHLALAPLSSKVVVTAQALPLDVESDPAPVTILTRKEMEQRQAVSLPELLATQPGFSLGRTGPEGGTASLFLDGGNSNYTKVLIDGIPANQPGGLIDLSSFTVDNLEKVEVVHGAQSALYGSDAMDGVIQVFTRRGTSRVPEFTVYGEGGNFSTGRGGADLAGLLGRFDYSAGVSDLQTQGEGPNDAFRNRTLSGNFGWRLGDGSRASLVLRDTVSAAGTPGQTLLQPPNLDDSIALHNFNAGLRVEFTSGAHWRGQLSGTETYNRELNIDPFFLTSFQYNRANVGAQSTYLKRGLGVTAGYEYEVENGFISFIGVHARRNNQAGYLDARWQPVSRLTLSAGARAEDNATFGVRVMPRGGIAYALRVARGPVGDTRLRASYGQGIVEPRFDQTYGLDPCFPGNPRLDPEQSRTIHAGVEQKFAADRVRFTADYFDNRFHNIISFQSVLPAGACLAGGAPFGAGTFFNTNLARARGVNLSAEARLTSWLTMGAHYTYDATRTLAAPNAFDPNYLPGDRLLRRPLNSGNAMLNAGFRRMNANLNAYFSGPRADYNFPGQVINPGYARFDVAGAYRLAHGLSFYGRIVNVANKRYQEAYGFPALGREFRLGLKYTTRRE